MVTTDIKDFLPQRYPVLMVDGLTDMDDCSAETIYRVKPDVFFFEGQALSEVALIEHIAQSASVFAGYRAVMKGCSHPPVGYIGEIKNFHCYRCPVAGELLRTKVMFELEYGTIAVVQGVTYVNDEKVAETELKIVLNTNE